MKKSFESVLIGAMVLAVFFAIVYSFALGIDKTEEVACLKLQAQASSHLKDFYITKTEKDMCDFHHIAVEAEVR